MTAIATAQASGLRRRWCRACRREWRARLFRADDCAQGDAASQWLGQRGYVGQNAVVLVGAPLAGAAHAGLNLIGDQQSSRRTGQGARLGEELLRNRAHAALALDGFDEDGAKFIGEFWRASRQRR